jgi:ABC-2 type transport system permease protein
MNVRIFTALLLRDITVVRREFVSFLVRTTMQPLLFVIIFGFVLPKMGVMPQAYSGLMLPGVLALSLALSAIQAVSLPMVQDFGYSKEIEDRLLAPAPTALIAIEKVAAGTIQGFVAAAFVLPIARLVMGPIPLLSFSNLGILIAATIIGGAAFSALGLWMGTAIPPQQIGVMFSVILAPMIMFGCAYYPWRGLDRIPFMKYAVLINPLTYVSEALRGALTPRVPHMSLPVALLALFSISAFFYILGMRSFMKRAIS